MSAIIIGGLLVIAAILAFLLYQSETDKPTLSINVSEDGIEIDGNWSPSSDYTRRD